jgi:osmotically-inducible protein OsmY
MTDEPSEYLVQHIRERLAQDPRVNELDIQVVVAGERVFVTGHVATQERQETVKVVVEEIAPGYEVCNETTVNQPTASPEVEQLG